MDKISETGYDIYLLCAMIADHVTLLDIFLPNFCAEGCLKKVAIFQKNSLIFLIFWHFAGA